MLSRRRRGVSIKQLRCGRRRTGAILYQARGISFFSIFAMLFSNHISMYFSMDRFLKLMLLRKQRKES